MKLRMKLPWCMVFVCLLYIPAKGQSVFGSVHGEVTDPSGALITDATVTLHDFDKNITIKVESSSQGRYEFLNVPAGQYELLVEHAGFTASRAQFDLDSRANVAVDAQLNVAVQAQSIDVTAAPPSINTENGIVSDRKNFEQVERLPLNYRASWGMSPLFARATAPGVVGDDYSVLVSVNGALTPQVDFNIDGVSTMIGAGTSPDYYSYPSSEMVSEFTVSSISNTAEYAKLGDISISTKSGTNQIHGSAAWYHQNSALDARAYGAPSKPLKVNHTVAGSLGGPVVLPGVYDGRNRTFFFGDVEVFRQPAYSLYQGYEPTAAWRGGDLNGLPGGPAVDPSTGAPFPGNRIPLSQLNPVSQKLLNKYLPLPNTSTPGTYPNYIRQDPTGYFGSLYDLRIDQMLGSKQRVFAHWNWSGARQESTYFPLNYQDAYPWWTKNLAFVHTYTPYPNVSNEFRLGFTADDVYDSVPVQGKDVAADLGLRGLDLSVPQAQGGFPSFNFSDATGFNAVGRQRAWRLGNRSYQFNDTLGWIRGKHTWKFGADARRLTMLSPITPFDYGNFTFLANTFSGNAFANFLLGLPAMSQIGAGPPNPDYRGYSLGFFAQDAWRVSRSLTVSLGLRWELHPPMTEASGNVTNFDHQTGAIIIPDHSLAPTAPFLASLNACSASSQPGACTPLITASQAGLPPSLRNTDWGDWAPRFGIAWRPLGPNTVFRGGGGIYFQPMIGPLATVITGIHSAGSAIFSNSLNADRTPLFAFPDVAAGVGALPAAGTAAVSGIDPTLPDARSYEWSASIEHEIRSAVTLRVTYQGLQSIGMPLWADFNQVPASTIPYSASRRPFPLVTKLRSAEALGFSNYQGLQIEAQRRFYRDFFFQASYTWAKNLTNLNAGSPGITPMLNPLSGYSVTDRFNTRMDRGHLDGFRDQQASFSGLFPIPVGKGRSLGRNWTGWRNGVFGGWELSAIGTLASGVHQNVVMPAGWDASNTNPALRTAFPRPDQVGNPQLADPSPNAFYNLLAFARPPEGSGRFGNAGSGILTGPGLVTAAAGLSRTTAITEHLRLRIEATFTNIANHPNFFRPVTDISSPGFGKLTRSIDNRVGQLGARLDW